MFRKAKRKIRRLWRERFPLPEIRHPLVGRRRVAGIEIVELAGQEILTVGFDNAAKTNTAYHAFGNDWWLQPRCPESFKYLSIDALYPKPYFEIVDHPSHATGLDLVDYMRDVFERLFGRPLRTVLELGSGGGEITRAFQERGLDFLAVEGTDAGVRRLRDVGIPAERIRQHNLKFMPQLDRRFDLVMCTEVAEHIEPFFASKVVHNCIAHADAVWFSAADRNRRANYHHPNEQAIEVWDNLFAHMGHRHLVELDGRHARAARLYMNDAAVAALIPP